jgi:hypothetical protein
MVLIVSINRLAFIFGMVNKPTIYSGGFVHGYY